jgi:hypothetical protein
MFTSRMSAATNNLLHQIEPAGPINAAAPGVAPAAPKVLLPDGRAVALPATGRTGTP